MRFFLAFVGILIIVLSIACNIPDSGYNVLTGLDLVNENQNIFENKRIGIIANHTAYDKQNRFITEIFSDLPGVQIKALFAPEHGFSGTVAAGGSIADSSDSSLNIPIYSLYGETRKPTPEMLKDLDLLMFDMQDVGARFYTYTYTMSLAMEAAAENNIKFVVLDRPNPLNGEKIEGNLLEPDFATFVGLYPIPVRHGMTIGELAEMINGEGWLSGHIHADLTVIRLRGWKRNMWFDQTGLTWRPPSPNIPTLDVAIAYPGMCLFEGTNISEGRGTYSPFLRIGAPWFNTDSFSQINQIISLAGIHFGPISFVPKSIPAMAPSPKYLDQECNGVNINISDRESYNSYLTGIALVKYLYDANKEKFEWRIRHFDRLCGTDNIRRFIMDGRSVEEIAAWIGGQEEIFRRLRQKYLLYE